VAKSVDEFVRARAIKLANGHTRRGFLARVGAGGIALGTAGLVSFRVPRAEAVCAGRTTTCYQLYGYNHCPGGYCEDGSWCVSSGCDDIESGCSTRWRDCCIRTADCPGGCHNAGSGVTCCNDCIYGDVCSPSAYKVRCRYHVCC
jgi:hypothetical protein